MCQILLTKIIFISILGYINSLSYNKNSKESILIIYNRQGQNLSVDQLIYMPSVNSQ